mmetsp:Transcript_56207/g.68741  ORF Transcript_56207/g.68741 Transcript_56207/m.68741 type:complete len:432 (+) Transcript_56207:167-1462(+)
MENNIYQHKHKISSDDNSVENIINNLDKHLQITPFTKPLKPQIFFNNKSNECYDDQKNISYDDDDVIDNDIELNQDWLIFKQVITHIINDEPFDVVEYLAPKLSDEELNDCKIVLNKLKTRNENWRIRLQIIEYIGNQNENDELLIELTKDINIGNFLLALMTQINDERTNLSKEALYMFPNTYGLALQLNSNGFNYLNEIMTSLFVVLRNTRSKILNELTDECIVLTIDVIMEWHQNNKINNDILLELCAIFHENTLYKNMKHDIVRQKCVSYFGYILFGVQYINTIPLNIPDIIDDDSINNNNSNNDEPRIKPFIISDTMKRDYLLRNHNEFINYFTKSVVNGCQDKDAKTRKETFELLHKIDILNKNYINNIILNNETLIIKKYSKWKERTFKSKSTTKGKKGKKKRKRIKKNNKKNAISNGIHKNGS